MLRITLQFFADEVVANDEVMMPSEYAKLADTEALEKDQIGYTNPNLHRRITPEQPSIDIQGGIRYCNVPLRSQYKSEELYQQALLEYRKQYSEVSPREYKLLVAGGHSYRITTKHLRDESLPDPPLRADYPSDEAFIAAMDEYLHTHEIP